MLIVFYPNLFVISNETQKNLPQKNLSGARERGNIFLIRFYINGDTGASDFSEQQVKKASKILDHSHEPCYY